MAGAESRQAADAQGADRSVPRCIVLAAFFVEGMCAGRLGDCDSLDQPVGLDDKAPEFSWVLKAVDPKAHGLTQSAYRIMVASTAEL